MRSPAAEAAQPRSTASACGLRCSSWWPWRSRAARAAQRAAGRRSRSARSGRSPTTIAASPGSTSVRRTSADTDLVLVPPQLRPRPTFAGRSLLDEAAPTSRSAAPSLSIHKRLAVKLPPPPGATRVAATGRRLQPPARRSASAGSTPGGSPGPSRRRTLRPAPCDAAALAGAERRRGNRRHGARRAPGPDRTPR